MIAPEAAPPAAALPPQPIAAAVPAPVAGMDPFISLATAVHAGAGVYALLLGSGVSSGAGIPTGWQIVQDLVRRAACVRGDESGPELDVEAWWAEHGDGTDLGYSSLLDALSTTAAGRDQLLRGFFEASDEDRQEGRKLPTAAHLAIAELVARGSVRVIVTTNFDRLLEQALEQRGLQPQVIHRADQIAGMTPLAHSRVTIIKLHGDYADLDKRNTVDELSTYPPELERLLTGVLADYGLLTCGWSGDWDVALVRAIEGSRSRRYPLFWSSFSQPGLAARRLIAQTGAAVLPGMGADALFTGLVERLSALDQLAAPALTRDVAVARLKRALPDPVRRIEMHDLVVDELRRVELAAADAQRYPTYLPGIGDAEMLTRMDALLGAQRAECDTLLHLLAAGSYHGGPEHNALWTLVIRRLLTLKRHPNGTFNDVLVGMRAYPALLAAMTMLAAASAAGRDELVAAVLTSPTYQTLVMNAPEPACHGLHPWRVLRNDVAKQLPRWNRQPNEGHYLFGASHLLRADLDPVLAAYEPDADRRTDLFSRAELLLALAQVGAGDRPFTGEYVLPARYGRDQLPLAAALRASVLDGTGPLLDRLFAGDREAATRSLDELDVAIVQAAQQVW